MTTYELWNTEFGNIAGTDATEAEALRVVRQAVAALGAAYADGLALVLDEEEADVRTVAAGAEFVGRAYAELGRSAPRSPSGRAQGPPRR